MNLSDLDEYLKIKNEICPHTGQKYNCPKCNFERPKRPSGARMIHCCMSVSGPIERDNKKEWNSIGRDINIGGMNPTGMQIKGIFLALNNLGVECLPIGECDNFCYKLGCLGHESKDEE